MSTELRTYRPATPIWCAGCGHYGVLNALRSVIEELGVPLDEIVLLAGIGCSGTIQNYLGTYGYHALHGRVLPTATGVACANPELTVIAAGGDGDGYAIGAGHLVHAFRRNASFTYVCMNNETYGLTKGQASPSSFLDAPASTLNGPLLGLAIASTTFVARAYSGSFDQLRRLTRSAIEHARARRGFAFLEVISPCVTYADTYPVWEETIYDVDADPSYDREDRARAFTTAVRLSEEHRLPVGLLYRSPDAAPRAAASVPARAPLASSDLGERYRALLARYRVR
jgi:2-oxoglutarate ferredoxin oxidoreductase subunit beta